MPDCDHLVLGSRSNFKQHSIKQHRESIAGKKKKKVSPCSRDSPEDLEGGQHGGYDVTNRVDLGHCDQRDLDGPGKAQDHVL